MSTASSRLGRPKKAAPQKSWRAQNTSQLSPATKRPTESLANAERSVRRISARGHGLQQLLEFGTKWLVDARSIGAGEMVMLDEADHVGQVLRAQEAGEAAAQLDVDQIGQTHRGDAFDLERGRRLRKIAETHFDSIATEAAIAGRGERPMGSLEIRHVEIDLSRGAKMSVKN